MTLNTWFRKPQQTGGKAAYIYAYILVDGKKSKPFSTLIRATRTRFDAGFYDKQIAQLNADLLTIQAILLGELGRVPYADEIRSKLLAMRKPKSDTITTVSSLITDKLATAGRGGKTYTALFESLNRKIPKTMQADATLFTEEDARCLITKLSESYKPASVHVILAMFSHAFELAAKKKKIKSNPFRYTEKPKVATNIISLSNAQIELLKANRNKYVDLFLFQIETGLSYIDTQTFCNDNIHEIDGQKFFEGRRKKTGKQFFGKISELAAEILSNYDQRPPRINYETYRVCLKKQLKNLAIENITSHKARHTLARKIIEKSGRLDIVSACLGSDKKTIEKHYGKQTLQGFAELLEKSGL